MCFASRAGTRNRKLQNVFRIGFSTRMTLTWPQTRKAPARSNPSSHLPPERDIPTALGSGRERVLRQQRFDPDPGSSKGCDAMRPLIPVDAKVVALSWVACRWLPPRTGISCDCFRKAAKAYGTSQLVEGGDYRKRLGHYQDVIYVRRSRRWNGQRSSESWARRFSLSALWIAKRAVLCPLQQRAELRSLFTLNELHWLAGRSAAGQ